MKTILFLAANPQGTHTLRWDRELSHVKESLQRSQYRDRFTLAERTAVSPMAIQRAILEVNPQIVHFAGHGGGENGIVFENEVGQPKFVDAEALAGLFKLVSDQVECVVLNACYSEIQAEAIVQHIPYVIGMEREIGDTAAQAFAWGFYDALGAGNDFEYAYNWGCSAIRMEGIREHLTPKLKRSPKLSAAQPIALPNLELSNVTVVAQPKRIFISYKRNVEPDESVAMAVFHVLSEQHKVFIDQTMPVGIRWAEQIEAELRQADFAIVFISASSVRSEMVVAEVEQAHSLGQENSGRPAILPVRLAYQEPFEYPLSKYLNPINWAFWRGSEDTPRLIEELKRAISGGELSIGKIQSKADLLQIGEPSQFPQPFPAAQPRVKQAAFPLEMPEGTMECESKFYVERPKDAIALQTITRPGVTITIKAPRQMGKSSLLIRTIDAAREAGKRVAFLDFQLIDKAALNNAELFFRQFCTWLTDELEITSKVDEYWNTPLGNSQLCTRYVERYILKELGTPLVLAMDEVESVLDTDFRSDFFGMLRSWHNNRATKPIWKKLDLALVTSTEPYQLIENLNQSPFNVGQVIEITDFTPEEVNDLNRRHGSPLNSVEEQKLMVVLGGHPYLVRQALYSVASQSISTAMLFETAIEDRGPFGNHLRYHLFRLHGKEQLVQGLLQVIRQNTCQDEIIFFRLRGAGLVVKQGRTVLPRCQLYADYFREHLRG